MSRVTRIQGLGKLLNAFCGRACQVAHELPVRTRHEEDEDDVYEQEEEVPVNQSQYLLPLHVVLSTHFFMREYSIQLRAG